MSEYLAFIVKKNPMDVQRIVELPRGLGGGAVGAGGEGGCYMAAGGGSSGSAAGEGPSKKEVDLVSLRGGLLDVAVGGWLAVMINREREKERSEIIIRGGTRTDPFEFSYPFLLLFGFMEPRHALDGVIGAAVRRWTRWGST